jgi:hypothetical protein
MPLAGLLEAMMAGKFEWQFKYRDEADVNGAPLARAGNSRSPRIAGTSAIRQIRFTLGSWENDNHRAQWRAPCGYNLRAWRTRRAASAIVATARPCVRTSSAFGNGRAACPRLPRANAARKATRQTDCVAIRSTMCGKGMPAIPRPQGTRASANTSGPDSNLARRPLMELRSPLQENRTERRKLVSSAGPQSRTIRPLT